MTSRNLLNLLLVIVLAGLLALAIYEPGKKEKPLAKAITELELSAIKKVRIESVGHAAIFLEKPTKQWRMREPFAMPANEGRIQQLLKVAQAKSLVSYPMSRVDANQLQLDAPTLSLTLNDVLLRFGATTALDGSRYVQVGNTVHLITDRYSHLARTAASDFVSPALLPEAAKIKTLQLASTSVMPQDEKAQSLLQEWRHARAMRVSVIAKAAAPGESVVVAFEADKSLRFDVLRTETEIILQRADINLQYHFPLEAGQRLLALPEPESTSVE